MHLPGGSQVHAPTTVGGMAVQSSVYELGVPVSV